MTQQELVAFYPQFANFTPAVVLTTYVDQANARFSRFSATDAEEARRLYCAHKLTMYSRVALPDGMTPTKAAIAAAGQAQAQITSKQVDDVKVTYSTKESASAAVSTGFADLAQTDFGLQLLALLRLYHATQYIR